MIRCNISNVMFLQYALDWQQALAPFVHGNGIQGQASDIKIMSEHIQKNKQRLNRILAENTGRSAWEIERDTERDNFMSAEEALQYGLIDSVISKRKYSDKDN